MRRSAFLVLAIVVLGAGAYWASPYRSIAGMKRAVDAGDSEALDRYIDYPLLRDNLKQQLRSGVSAYLQGDGQEDNPFAALGGVLAGRLGDSLVDSWVTPEGVAELLRGKAAGEAPSPDADGSDAGAGRDDRLLRDPRLSFRSISEVEVVALDDQDREITFVMVRHGAMWKLTNIILPLTAGG